MDYISNCAWFAITVSVLARVHACAVQCDLPSDLQSCARAAVAAVQCKRAIAFQEFRVWTISVALTHLWRGPVNVSDCRDRCAVPRRVIDEVRSGLLREVNLLSFSYYSTTQLTSTYLCSVLMTAAAVAWFVDALAARQSYAAEFYSSLRQGYLDLTSPLVDFTPDQVRGPCFESYSRIASNVCICVTTDRACERNSGCWGPEPSQLRAELAVARAHWSILSSTSAHPVHSLVNFVTTWF